MIFIQDRYKVKNMKKVQWVGCILFKRKFNQILLVKTAGLEKGKWGLPAGHLETGESILEGAKREAEEETGLNIELNESDYVNTYDGELKANDGIMLKGKYHIYATEKFSGKIKTTEMDVQWFVVEDVLKGPETSFVLHGTEHILKPRNKEAIRDFLKKLGMRK